MNTKFASALIVVLMCACGGGRAALRPGAEQVSIVTALPTDGQYTPLGDVSCQYGSNFGSAGGNTERCRNELRNEALDLGGSVVVITTQTIGGGTCQNCVVMFGTAYQRAAAPPAPTPVEATAAPADPATTSGGEAAPTP